MRVTVNVLLLLAAIVFAVVFTIQAFDWWQVDHPFGWLGLSLLCFEVSFVTWGRQSAA